MVSITSASPPSAVRLAHAVHDGRMRASSRTCSRVLLDARGLGHVAHALHQQGTSTSSSAFTSRRTSCMVVQA